MKHELKSDLKINTNVLVEVYRASDLELLQSIETHNKIPLVGRRIVRDLIARGLTGTGAGFAPSHVAVGTSATAETDSDTLLGGEVFRAPVSYRARLSSGLQIQLFLTDLDANGYTLKEAGLFDTATASAGNMFARVTFDPVVKTSSIKVLIYWTINIAS